MDSLKKEFLELLDRDLEFRYAVAGYLGLGEILKRLDTLSEEQKNLREEQIRLREDFNKMLARLGGIELRLGRVKRTLEKLTVDVEDEARSIIRQRLREIGISLELEPLTLPDLEINLYGVSDDICLIGEATVRGGPKLVDELLEKLKKLKKNYPDRLRGKIILVIYVSLPMPELIEKAKEQNIWLLKATQDYYKPEKPFQTL